MTHDTSNSPHLCFVRTHQLNGPLVEPLDVWTTEGRRIGSFEGVVVDPEEKRARFLVVDRGRFRPNRCLIPLPARLDVVHHTLCVDADDIDPEDLPAFDARSCVPFTADQQLNAA